MSGQKAFTIVVPTRDNPRSCRQLLESLAHENQQIQMDLRVVFLANDTCQMATAELEHLVLAESFAALQPAVLRAPLNYLTAEENIRHTLGGNLGQVNDHFLIVGNTDRISLRSLRDALEYLCERQLDLLLVGTINREVYQSRIVRQLYTTPRHLNPKNRLGAVNHCGKDVFSDAITDYGPVDYLAFIGCQIYTKKFFRDLCDVEAEFPDPLYSHPMGTLELTARQTCAVGFFPEIVVIRVDDLEDTVNSPGRYKTGQGLSSHILLSVLTNSLYLSPPAFGTLVNAQMVAMLRGKSQYQFSNFLFTLMLQISSHVKHSGKDAALRYTGGELQDIVTFGKRLEGVDIGLPPVQCKMISQWLQHFSVIGNYCDPAGIDALLAGSSPVLALLDERPGMERWAVQLA